MSLILDALNKADQERSEQHEVPNLRAVHGSPYPQARPGLLKRWRVEIVIVVLLLLAYLSYQLFMTGSEQPQQEPRPLVTEAPVVPELSPVAQPLAPSKAAPAGVPTKAAPHAAQAPGSAAGATPPETVGLPIPDVKTPVDSAVEREAVSPAGALPEVKSLYARQRGETQTPERTAATAPAVSMPEATKPETAEPPAPSSRQPANAASELKARLGKLPLLSDLSPQKQASIPSIDFSLHVYSNDQGAGFVTLNGQRRRAGDQVAPGLRLENIVDEFVVLSYEGARFRLLSLNSWINLQ